MICKIQVVTIGEDGCQETLEIACLERTDLKPETLGLTLAEAKMILKDLQQIVVECQVSSSLLLKQACPDCGEPRCTKGNHTLLVRSPRSARSPLAKESRAPGAARVARFSAITWSIVWSQTTTSNSRLVRATTMPPPIPPMPPVSAATLRAKPGSIFFYW